MKVLNQEPGQLTSIPSDEFKRLSAEARAKKCRLEIVDFKNCRTQKEALVEIGRSLNFPKYFGQNLDALVDCLADHVSDLGPQEGGQIYYLLGAAKESHGVRHELEKVVEIFIEHAEEKTKSKFSTWVFYES